MAEPGVWNFAGTKKGAKEEKAAESVLESVDAEPVSAKEVEQDEPDPKKAEAVNAFATWGARTTSDRNKKKKGNKAEPKPELPKEAEQEPEPVPEVIREPEPGKEEGDDFWGTFTASKKYKKKKGCEPELEPSKQLKPPPMEEPASMEESKVMAGPAPAISPIEEGWVGGEPGSII